MVGGCRPSDLDVALPTPLIGKRDGSTPNQGSINLGRAQGACIRASASRDGVAVTEMVCAASARNAE